MDAKQLLGALRTLVSLIPLIARVSVLHALRLSETSRQVDLRSALIVAIVRAMMLPSRPQPMAPTQRLSLRDTGPKGRIWVSKYTAPAPEPISTGNGGTSRSLVDPLVATIESLAGPGTSVAAPDVVPVEAEWTGYRAGAGRKEALPASATAQQLYRDMMAECANPETTVLYLHGGGFSMCDPATHRGTTKTLARLTGGRCYSVRYRLAPQHPFPAALLDALVSYLTLLYPPEGAFHEAVRPEDLVLAGDSAGGNLCLVLVRLLLELNRSKTPVPWHGGLLTFPIPLPAGVAVSSPWVDPTQSSPSWRDGSPAPFDYLPTLPALERLAPRQPPCKIWPADPPRRNMYVSDALVTHPLVTLALPTRPGSGSTSGSSGGSGSGSGSWHGAPPVYMCYGWERIAREVCYLAQRLRDDGVPVVLDEFEAMPHCFSLVLGDSPTTRRCYDGWAAFIRAAVEDPKKIESRAVRVAAKTLEEAPLEFDELGDDTEEEFRRWIVENTKWAEVNAGEKQKGELILPKL